MANILVGSGQTTVADLSDSIVLSLNKDSTVIATDSVGSGGVFTNAVTTATVLVGGVDDTANWTFTKSDNNTTSAQSGTYSNTYSVTALSTDDGDVTIIATKKGVSLNKKFSLSKSKAGTPGTSAKSVRLRASSLIFRRDSSNAISTPSWIQFDAVKQNTTNTVTWSTSPAVNLYTASTGGSITTTGDTVFLRSADVSTNTQIDITATITADSISDTTKIVTLREGSDVITPVLGNPYHLLPTTNLGVIDYNNSGTTIKVFEGATARIITACTITADLGSFSVPGTASGTGTSTVTISAHSGTMTGNPVRYKYGLTYTKGDGTSATLDVYQTLAKATQGSDGSPGTSPITGYLTVSANTVVSKIDGTGYTLPTGGTFKIFQGTTDRTTSSVFAITGGTDNGTNWTKVQNGLTFTIQETTGVYTLSGASWTSNEESFTVTGTYSGSTVTLVYNISKAKAGPATTISVNTPTGVDGVDGDFWYESDADIYYIKNSGTWTPVEITAAKITTGNLTAGVSIKSTTYTPGSAGFSINADGTAEFGSAIVRGTLQASQIKKADGTILYDTADGVRIFGNATQDNYSIGDTTTGGVSSTYGSNNLAFGQNALNATGSSKQYNVAIGTNSLKALTGPSNNNIGIGRNAGWQATSLTSNVFIGTEILNSYTTGLLDSSVFIGNKVCRLLTSGGSTNVIIGNKTLSYATSVGIGNIVIGDSIGDISLNPSGVASIGNNSVYLGAGINIDGTYLAGGSVTIGAYAGVPRTSATSYDVCIGWNAGFNSTGISQVIIGSDANGGAGSVSIGRLAGASLNATGSNNIIVGFQAATNLTTGSNNIVIGANLPAQSATGSNNIDILTNTGTTGIQYTNSTGTLALKSAKLQIPTNTSVTAPAIFFEGDSNTGIYQSVADRIDFASGGSLALSLIPTTSRTVYAPGQITINSESIYAGDYLTTTALLHMHASTATNTGMIIGNWNTSATAAGNIEFTRSNSGAIGTYGNVVTGNALGNIRFSGALGTAFKEGARIGAKAGTIGASFIGGTLEFYTGSSTAAPTVKMSIDENGLLTANSNIGGGGTTNFLRADGTWAVPPTGGSSVTLTGDVTGSGTGTIATTIGTNKVTLAMMATMATASFLGRNTAAVGNVEVLSAATAKTMLSLTKSDVGLANVENTALSTWAGSTNITTLGTIATGTWNATAIADGKIASALTGKTYNGLTLTSAAAGFTIAGGTTSKTLTVSNTLTLTGADTASIAFGSGGTVGYINTNNTWTNQQTFNATPLIKSTTALEGGELQLEKGSDVTVTLAANVAIDLYGNTFRVFEAGGTARGFKVDLTTLAASAGSTLITSSSLGTNVQTFLATPTTANFIAAISDEGAAGTYLNANGTWTTPPSSGLSTSTTSTQTGYFGSIAIGEDGLSTNYLTLAINSGITAPRTVTFDFNDASRTITFPGTIALTLVGTSQTQTLTNKTIVYGSNTLTDVAGTAVSNTFTANQSFIAASGASVITIGNTGSAGTTCEIRGKNFSSIPWLDINSGTNALSFVTITTGGTLPQQFTFGSDGTLGLQDSSQTAAISVQLAATSSVALTANRKLTFDVVNAARTIKLAGNLDIANNLTTSGNFALTLTTTNTTNVTLPTTGTLLATNGSGSSLTFGTGTLSLAGNVTHAGAFTQTFTATGNTSVTLPTSGTLIANNGAIRSTSTTAGIGYSITAGAVTQLTSKATGVTSNTVVTNITLAAVLLAANTTVSFTFTNSTIAANDIIYIMHYSVGSIGSYNFSAAPAAGSATIYVRNITATGLTEGIVIRVVVIKG